jgi:hypothetical protein
MPSSVERIGTPAPAASPSSFSFNRAFESLKSGSNPEQTGKIFTYAKLLTDQAKQALIGNLERVERCSKAFSERFLSDASLFRRASKIGQNFAENGEPMSRLEEAEIYTELMEPGSDDIRKALEASDPSRSFSNLVPLEKTEIAAQKLAGMKDVVDENKADPVFQQMLRDTLQTALSNAGAGSIDDPDVWKRLATNKTAMEIFKQSPGVRELYKASLNEQDIDSAERSLEMIWRDEDGEVRPVMHIQRYAKNPENGYVSQMGFDIEKEGGKRVIKNVSVATDADSRGKNQGPEFLFNLLPLIKTYKLSEAEFEANMKIGSYVWTKIADVDVGAMRKYLPEQAQDELKEAAGDAKRQKSIVMKDFILPQFEQNMERAFASLTGTDAQTSETVAKLRAEYQMLRQKALSGEATMEDLAALGKESDLFRFDKEGEIVDPRSPEAALRGHLGKAAIMGIPWKAKVPLDRAGLFRIIDKLHKGTGLMASLKRTSMKFGLLLSA